MPQRHGGRQRLCGRGSRGEARNRAGDGFRIDGFRHSAYYGHRNPPSVNACRHRHDDQMAQRTSSRRAVGVMMTHHSKRHPHYQQEDHDRDDYTPGWLRVRHLVLRSPDRNCYFYGTDLPDSTLLWIKSAEQHLPPRGDAPTWRQQEDRISKRICLWVLSARDVLVRLFATACRPSVRELADDIG